MSVSGKKDFDVKQILRLRWRWFSHSSQGSAGSGGGSIGGVGGYIQQDGLDHRGTPVQGRLKSHSRERGIGGLRKTSSPVHSILAPTPVCVRAGSQSWPHQQNSTQAVQINEESSKTCSSPGSNKKKEVANTGKEVVKSSTEEPAEVEARERYDCLGCFAKETQVYQAPLPQSHCQFCTHSAVARCYFWNTRSTDFTQGEYRHSPKSRSYCEILEACICVFQSVDGTHLSAQSVCIFPTSIDLGKKSSLTLH